jgi:tetratricopeptide (TPR) repeat protein
MGMTGSPDRWSQVDDLFDAALDLPAERRAAFLDGACAADPGLRAAVERLLRAHDCAGRFLEEPAPVFGAALLVDPASRSARLEGTRLGSYTIIDEIGHGGMGVVYRARDERLDRLVALKFLPPALGADEHARHRLLAEARAASALDHPGVAVVHEIGETGDGQLFIAMTCYEGETLGTMIARGPVPAPDAIGLAVQIADALAAAHRKGVIHRDIKPANVIVTREGVVKIVDFGIARITGAAPGPEATRGTLAYMSPEQLCGGGVDAGTDLWSLGVVLYEMVTGRPPFRGADAGSLIRAIRTETPAPIRSLVPAVPPELAAIVQRCLEKDPARRYPDAGALHRALRSLQSALLGPAVGRRGRRARRTVLAGLAAMAAAGVTAALTFQGGASVAPPVVAVGPLTHHGTADTLSVASAVADMLATNLARVPELRVVSGARMYEIRAQLGDVHGDATWISAARHAGAGELIEGALHPSAAGLRLDLRRVDLRTGAVRAEYTVAGADAFELVDRATAEIGADLGLSAAALHLADVTTTSFVAYRFYEEGLRSYAEGDFRGALRLFDTALAEDSTFALAAHYAWASRTGLFQPVPSEVRARLLRLADRATDRERLIIRSVWAEGEASERVAIADTLVARYPTEPDGHLLLGGARVASGDFLGALPYLERVVTMDSLGLRGTHARCRACEALGEIVRVYALADSTGAAERVARGWVRLQPQSARAWHALANILEAQERHDEAGPARRRATEISPGHLYNALYPAISRMLAGDYGDADRLLHDLARDGTPEVRLEALWFLTISLRYQGRLREALETVHRARLLNPGGSYEAPGRQHEAQVLLEMGRAREAAQRFDSVASTPLSTDSPGSIARHWSWNLTHRATALAAAGDTSALAMLADTIEAWGRSSSYGRDQRLHHHVRGLLLAARGEPEAAAAEYRRALYSTTYGYTRTNLELARALLDLDRPLEAVAVLEPALRGSLEASNLYVTRTEVHELLGRAWDAAGEPDRAAAHYRRVLHAWRDADPPFHARRDRVRDRLARLGAADATVALTAGG